MSEHPTLGNGKICYLEIPATDIDASAKFYATVFGWNVRKRSDGETAFDDGVGEVSGTWISGRKPATDPEVTIYIIVYDIVPTIDKVEENGGKLVEPVVAHLPEITARFSDPAGNVFG